MEEIQKLPKPHGVHLVPKYETADPGAHTSHSTACAPLYVRAGQAAHATCSAWRAFSATFPARAGKLDIRIAHFCRHHRPCIADVACHCHTGPLYFPSGQTAHAIADIRENSPLQRMACI
jgi:hypothetical protein